MTRTIAFLYDSYDDAVAAVRDLEKQFAHDAISIVANTGNGGRLRRVTDSDTASDAASGAGTGAGIGAVVGGGAGLLAGLGAIAIPGIGPVVAAGWLAATLAGAAAGAGIGAVSGGIIEAMTGAGVSTEDAHLYAEGVRRGGTLVVARVDESQVSLAESIMRQHKPVDSTARRTAFRETGWKAFDPKAAPYEGTNDLPGQAPLRQTRTR
jgi:hypothetical protein